MSMSITIENIDQTILERLKLEAERQKIDLNALILSIIKKSLGLGKIKNRKINYNDLDSLAGTWTKQDYKIFIKNTSRFNEIDVQLWK